MKIPLSKKSLKWNENLLLKGVNPSDWIKFIYAIIAKLEN
jgi:hypothetical protein